MAGERAGAGSLEGLTTLFRVGAVGGLTDAELLGRFLDGGPAAEAAFAALVERHGPMVERVCSRELADPHDAQDAFQATFLVLVRKAGSVRKRGSAASWLYGVALRVARRARSQAARRRTRERREAEMASRTVGEGPPRESWPELHEEIARLPERYRESVVLCYLEGLSTEAAAERLGCPRGTVLSRLSRGRDRLRERLTRRGLAAPAALAAAGSTGVASASIPGMLVQSTVLAAISFAASRAAATGGSFPSSAAALANGVLRTMFLTKAKLTAAAVLTTGFLTVGAGAIALGGRADDPPRADGALRGSNRLGGQRFALIGRMDIDRDGTDDRARLRRMILDNGGLIDYDLPPEGPASGKIGPRTAWYVEDVRATPGAVGARRKAEEAEAVIAARNDGVRPLSLERLLARIRGDGKAGRRPGPVRQ